MAKTQYLKLKAPSNNVKTISQNTSKQKKAKKQIQKRDKRIEAVKNDLHNVTSKIQQI